MADTGWERLLFWKAASGVTVFVLGALSSAWLLTRNKPQPKSSSTPEMLSLLCDIAEDRGRRSGSIHRSIICDNCHATPIVGIRYHCLNCPDTDVCENCVDMENSVHNKTHMLLRIPIPLPIHVHLRDLHSEKVVAGVGVNKLEWNTLQKLQAETNFSIDEIRGLFEQFCCWSEDGCMTFSLFLRALGSVGLPDNLLVHSLFQMFDQQNSGQVEFVDFLKTMHMFLKNDTKMKSQCAFRALDLGEKGYLVREDLVAMFKAALDVNVAGVASVVETMQAKMLAQFEEDSDRPVSSTFTNSIPEIERPKLSKEQINDMSTIGRCLNPTTPINSKTQALEIIVEFVDSLFLNQEIERLEPKLFHRLAKTNPILVSWIDSCGTIF